MKNLIRIVMVDDHGLFRFGLAAILKSDADLQLVGEFADADSFIASMANLNPDVVICDLSLGRESGLDVIKLIRNDFPAIKVLVMSMHKDEFHITHAIQAGAKGYLYKDDTPQELINGIKKVAKGDSYFSQEISNVWMNRLGTLDIVSHQPFLTKKEKEVIHFIMEGKTSKEIADKMNLSARTIETHRYNILSKFNLKNVAELVKLVANQKM